MCVVFVCVYVYKYVCMHVHGKARVNILCLPRLLFTLYINNYKYILFI